MSKKNIFIIVSAIISVSIIAWIINLGYEDFVKILSEVKPWYLAFAIISGSMAYICMGLSLREILKVLCCQIGMGAVIGIAFVSTAINYVVSSVGISGFALRAHLLKKRNVSFGNSVTSSVVTTVLLYAVLALLILQGCIFLVISSGGKSNLQIAEGFLGILFLAAICFLFAMAFFNHEFRSKWIRKGFKHFNHIIYFFSGNQIPQESFDKFEEQLEVGFKVIHEKKHKLTGALAYICFDWIFTLLTLYLSFVAIGVKINVFVLIAGFAVGIATTLIPILPGGLGAMELVMATAYSGLGIAWNSALVAVLIYRICYYLIPSLVSVFVYWGLKISEPLDLTDELEEEKQISQNIEVVK
jgi:glycosyltransferase 2 family protein